MTIYVCFAVLTILACVIYALVHDDLPTRHRAWLIWILMLGVFGGDHPAGHRRPDDLDRSGSALTAHDSAEVLRDVAGRWKTDPVTRRSRQTEMR